MVPRKFTAGDSISFAYGSFTDGQGRTVAPPAWSLSLAIRGNGNQVNSLSVSWSFSLSRNETKDLAPGQCFFQVFATNLVSGERVTVDTGRIEILPNLATADAAFDGRSQARKDLEQVQALIRQLTGSGKGVAEYKIGDRSSRKYELQDLIELESRLKNRVVIEEREQMIKAGLGNPNSVRVRFGR